MRRVCNNLKDASPLSPFILALSPFILHLSSAHASRVKEGKRVPYRGINPSLTISLSPISTTAILDAIWSIVKEEGVRGLYRGIGPSLVLVSHGAIQMAAYEELKQLMLALRSPTAWAPRTPSPPHVDSHPSSSSLPAVTELSPWDIAAVGATAKLCAASATYPYQMRPDEAGQLKYRNTRHAVTSMWRLEGARGFYKGFLPNLLRVMPSASITFAVYEVMLRLLKPHPLAPPQAHF
ncbi:unnamed protein product [Closterium sp. NIES-64]|nr:unnamed protein product [Closterium sp. NIES-64]